MVALKGITSTAPSVKQFAAERIGGSQVAERLIEALDARLPIHAYMDGETREEVAIDLEVVLPPGIDLEDFPQERFTVAPGEAFILVGDDEAGELMYFYCVVTT